MPRAPSLVRRAAGTAAISLVACGGEVDDGIRPSGPQIIVDEPVAGTPNDRCSGARTLTLDSGGVEVRGDTSAARDEFASLDCGSVGAAGALDGPQRYYAVAVRKAERYRLSLTAQHYAVLYALVLSGDQACTESTITTQCRGGEGLASALVVPGTPGGSASPSGGAGDVRIARDGTLVVGVDSDGGAGPFTLSISRVP